MQIRSSPLIKMPTRFYAASHVRRFSWLIETRLQRRKIKMQTPVRGASLFSNQGAGVKRERKLKCKAEFTLMMNGFRLPRRRVWMQAEKS